MGGPAAFAVIGAGPYGLALAYTLRRRGVMSMVFGVPMEAWSTHMPQGMYLKSEGRASSIVASDPALSLRRYCAEAGADYGDFGVPVPLETFTAYGRWFQQVAVPEVNELKVRQVSSRRGQFELTLENGEAVWAERVAVATGLTEFAHVPETVRCLPDGLVSHTAEHSDLSVFRGRTVAVLGCGQSALESAALIREAGGHPVVVARAREVTWNPALSPAPYSAVRRLRHPYAPLGPGWPLWLYSNFALGFSALPESSRRRQAREVLGPAGAWWLRERIEPDVEVLCGHAVSRCEPLGHGVHLVLNGPGGEVDLRVDRVLAGTGYRVDLSRLRLLAPELRQRVATSHGAPILSRNLESTVPGLYFTGAVAMNLFGPLMRFVSGAEFAARRVAAGTFMRAAALKTFVRQPASA